MAKSLPQDLFDIEGNATRQKWLWRRRVLNLIVVGLWVIALMIRFGKSSREHSGNTSTCDQPTPHALPSNLSRFTDEPGFADQAAKRLAGAVRIPTMFNTFPSDSRSFDDMGPVDQDKHWAPFEEMHMYLRKTFPLVHSELDLTIIGRYSLVYTWPGTVEESKPLMLTGHIDVVPSLTALDRWTYPPFSGTIDEEWIYGRGAGDCKNNVIGIMTAVEHLIAGNWKPTRTIILAFGQDEEISGPRGATNIGKYLEGIYGKNGIALIVDEGGMNLDTVYGKEFALPGIAEKGYLNVEIQVDMLGDTHPFLLSTRPSESFLKLYPLSNSSIFQPHIESKSPIWGYLSCVAQHGESSQIPNWIKKGVSSNNPDMDKMAQAFAEISVGNRYLVQTSKAATIFHAGLKSNALPESARVLFNSRVDLFSTPAKTREAYYSLIKPIAKKYSLLLDGASLSDASSIGNITVEPSLGHEPSPISPFTLDSEGWLIFSRAVQASFGPEVITAPSAMTGNTDTRYYWNLSENIYRWSPTRAGTKLNIHTVDEKIKIQTHVEGIKFYTELILQSDAMVSNSVKSSP
ncbi:hypothetical protein BDZ97DRAFT_2064261 [Flammula alnicola]|nr:hypothetical protein BDZ97DRAFT_2064261 [Flammula alnicola]